MRTTIKQALYALALFVLLPACKKDNDNDDNPVDPGNDDCLLVTYRCESRNETWRVAYNASGGIDSILIGDKQKVDEERAFSYDAGQNKITVNRFFKGTLDEINVIELTGEGKISSIRDNSPISSSWQQVSFTYTTDSRKLLSESTTTFSTPGAAFGTSFEWDINGNSVNMVKHDTPSGVFTYEYHLDKPTQAGDYLNFEKMISTYDKYHLPFTSTNLLKSIKMDGDPLVDVSYTFDNTGKIKSFAVSYDGSPDTETWDLAYQCK